MQPVKAHVKDGRLMLDEPTSLPEGQVVYLQPIEGFVVAEIEDRDADDRAALHADLEASLIEADAGETIDFSAAIAELSVWVYRESTARSSELRSTTISPECESARGLLCAS